MGWIVLKTGVSYDSSQAGCIWLYLHRLFHGKYYCRKVFKIIYKLTYVWLKLYLYPKYFSQLLRSDIHKHNFKKWSTSSFTSLYFLIYEKGDHHLSSFRSLCEEEILQGKWYLQSLLDFCIFWIIIPRAVWRISCPKLLVFVCLFQYIYTFGNCCYIPKICASIITQNFTFLDDFIMINKGLTPLWSFFKFTSKLFCISLWAHHMWEDGRLQYMGMCSFLFQIASWIRKNNVIFNIL